MNEIHYRAANSQDIPDMTDLFLLALNDLYQRHHVTAVIPPREAFLLGYEHVRSSGIFEVAVHDDKIVAIAGAVVRDRIWYLSAFWVHPALQRKRIGMPLLKRVWEAGITAGARIFFTWSSIDLTAMAAYMKLGMLPGYQNFFFQGTASNIPEIPSDYEILPLEKAVVMEIDLNIRGTKREPDHDFWFADPNIQGRQIIKDKQVIGYYYVNRGFIGPAAWNEKKYAEIILSAACREASALAPEIRFPIPGINHAALKFAFRSGLRLSSYAHFLSTDSFGHMDQFIPSGQLLF
ncbi:MAG: GNAT family N-acetyltransferase [bacterium]|nr:MAG: GNAT family N-acetyltransferase [bacterium]